MNKLIFLLTILPLSTFGQFKINEASNANGNTILMANGSSPDWIEIYNPSSSASDIGGYGLSDDLSNPMKWVFPSSIVPPFGFLTVFATNNSTLNSENTVDHYETVVFAEDIWEYMVPNSEIPSWKAIDFDSNTWASGQASIGYGDADDATNLVGPMISIYSRIAFQCNNLEAVSKAILDIDFDDGFVAYLNGIEIARSGLVGAPPLWDELSTDHEATLYQGAAITSFNLDLTAVKNAMVLGTNVLAIEIHNASTGSSDLTGKPYLTFGYNQPGTFSSGTVHQYFTSGFGGNLEAKFGLSTDGETIYLTNPSGTVVDNLIVNDLEPNMANGKFPDGSDTQVVFSVPTPNGSNNNSIAFDGYEKLPTIINVGGVYSASITVFVTNNSVSGGRLRYTTNGNNPDINSPLLTESVVLNTNSVLKVTCFPNGANLLPSIIATETFLFRENFTLPILSLTVDADDLYGENGIFDNWWTDWKKPCLVEYFDKNGKKQFETRSSVKPDGGAGGSRSNPQHSVTIEPANTTFGEGKPVHYPIISQKPYIQDYYALYIRNGSNFWNQYPQKDATFTRMMAETNVNSQAYTPAIVYLNGQYFGIYEIREKANEGYFENNYGNHLDSLDLLSVSYWYGAGVLRTVKGSDSSFYTMKDLITNSDPNSPNYFADSHKKLDLYNFTDYLAGENWFANVDWIYNNMKVARTRTYDNKWRFFLQDLEWGLGGWTDYNMNMFDWFRNNGNQPNPCLEIYEGLVQNTEFKNYFVNRFADLMNTTFLADHYLPIVNSMYKELIPELPRHLQMWTGDPNGGRANYDNIYNNLLYQFENRNQVVRNQMVTEYGLEEQVTVSLAVYPANAGYIKISTIIPEKLPWTGVYFDGVPVTITAVANPGYTFQSWDANATIPPELLTRASGTYNIPTNDLFRAVFTGSHESNSLTISEINYNPDPTVDGGNWIELHNYGNSSIDLNGYKIKSKLHWDKFSFNDQTILNAGAYLVICENIDAFKAQYPTVQNVVGGSGFGWSNKWDSVRIYNPFDKLFLSASYTDEAPFPKCADGWGRTLENNNLSQLPLDFTSWFCGCIGGSPGKAYQPCQEPIILSEFNYNNTNESYDAGDWIELYNNTSDSINLAGYVFKDSKEDNEFVFPSINLEAGAFLVVSNNLELFRQNYPLINNTVGDFNFGLSSSDGIRIYNNRGVLINSFYYEALAPWPVAPSRKNVTNEYNFYDGYLDQNNGFSWFAGCVGGSPGNPFANTCANSADDPSLALSDADFVSLYPNPATSNITLIIDNSKSKAQSAELAIYNTNGKLIEKRILENLQEPSGRVDVNVANFPQGVYFVRFLQTNRSITIPFIKL